MSHQWPSNPRPYWQHKYCPHKFSRALTLSVHLNHFHPALLPKQRPVSGSHQSNATANPGHALSNFLPIAFCFLLYKSCPSIRLFISIRLSLTSMNRSFGTHVGMPPVPPPGFVKTHSSCSAATLATDILRSYANSSWSARSKSICVNVTDAISICANPMIAARLRVGPGMLAPLATQCRPHPSLCSRDLVHAHSPAESPVLPDPYLLAATVSVCMHHPRRQTLSWTLITLACARRGLSRRSGCSSLLPRPEAMLQCSSILVLEPGDEPLPLALSYRPAVPRSVTVLSQPVSLSLLFSLSPTSRG